MELKVIFFIDLEWIGDRKSIKVQSSNKTGPAEECWSFKEIRKSGGETNLVQMIVSLASVMLKLRNWKNIQEFES